MKKIIISLLCLSFFLCIGKPVFSEDTTAPVSYRSNLQLVYLKTSACKSFSISLNYIKNDACPINGGKIKITAGPDRTLILGDVVTEPNGKIVFNLKSGTNIPKDAEGFYIVQAVYDGNDSIEATEAEVKFQDISLTMLLTEADSMRTVNVKCFRLNEKGLEVAPTDVTVNIYVARMFSYLKVGDIAIDSTGMGTFEFPADIVGDSIGNLTIIARIDENDVYGNAETKQDARWGIPTMHRVPTGYRALWTQIAPTWMVVTLMVLLLGVWGHYAYAIVKITRIKKAGNKNPAS